MRKLYLLTVFCNEVFQENSYIKVKRNNLNPTKPNLYLFHAFAIYANGKQMKTTYYDQYDFRTATLHYSLNSAKARVKLSIGFVSSEKCMKFISLLGRQ